MRRAAAAKGYKGITAVVVERAAKGFTVGKKEDKLGIRAQMIGIAQGALSAAHSTQRKLSSGPAGAKRRLLSGTPRPRSGSDVDALTHCRSAEMRIASHRIPDVERL